MSSGCKPEISRSRLLIIQRRRDLRVEYGNFVAFGMMFRTANPSGLGIRGVLYKLVYFQISVFDPMSVLPVFL